MLEMGERATSMIEVGVRHRGVLAHDVHTLDLVGVNRVHDLDHGLAALRIERHAPGRFVFRPGLGIFHGLVVGKEHGDQAGIGGALHVVLAAERMEPRAGTPNLAADQRQRDQAACVVGAMGVLRHTHSPEDDGALGARKRARNVAQHVRLDAADRGHLLGRERLHALGELVEILGIGLNILLVVKLLSDDDVEHRVEHRNVGAVLELHHLPGVALERLAARIHHDELRATLRGLLEEGRSDRVVFGRVGADDDDDIGILAFVEGRGHRRRADAFQQRRHRRRVAKPRAMIHVVRTEPGANQLLEEISLLVGAFRRAEAGERARPIAVADFHQAPGGAIERLFPGRRAKVGPRV